MGLYITSIVGIGSCLSVQMIYGTYLLDEFRRSLLFAYLNCRFEDEFLTFVDHFIKNGSCYKELFPA